MKPSKEIIILSDIEMGGGTITDDFISDQALSELILTISRKKLPVDLILNGDVFDFLKCPYSKDGRITYPRYITPEISLGKLEMMHQAHQPVFEALRQFVRKSRNNLYFTIGNHDYDVAYSAVQRRIKRLLGAKENIFFRWKYHQHQVYVEHGHQYDLLNNVNYKLLFLKYKGQTILNLPWTSFGLISKYMYIKEKYPFMDRIFPRPDLFSRSRNIAKLVTRNTLRYFLASVFYYPFRYMFDPTYTFPKKLFWNMFRRIKGLRWDLDEVTEIFQEKHRRILRKNKIFVFGHLHQTTTSQQDGGPMLIKLGNWRDEYTLDSATSLLTAKEKHYLRILVNGDDLIWSLLTYPVKRKPISFAAAAKDEIGTIRRAAQEEGFTLGF